MSTTTDLDSFAERMRHRLAMNPPPGSEPNQSHRNPLDTIPDPTTARPHGNIPNTPLAASTISFSLGALFCFGLSSWLSGGVPSASLWFATYQLGFFFAAWSFFHWAEFAVTAGWNFEKCSVDSFLLDNGREYHIANGTAVFEYLVISFFKPSWKTFPYVSMLGMLLVVVGQVLRSSAMIHASTNFSHAVAHKKREAHQLVTDGVYAWSRHPSYAGFIYWALGTQLVLQNPVTLLIYVAVLWRFFNARIRGEEGLLIRFFGQAYVDYRKRVGTGIPFIP